MIFDTLHLYDRNDAGNFITIGQKLCTGAQKRIRIHLDLWREIVIEFLLI